MDLLSNLRQFGLNPRDWKLQLKMDEPEKPMKAILTHTSIDDLKFWGECKIKETSGYLNLDFLNLNVG